MNKALLARNLSAFRHSQGATQGAIAKKAGLSRAGYINLEGGKAEPRPETLFALADTFGITVEDLLQERPQLHHIRFRSTARLKSRDQVVMRTARWLSRYNDLEAILDEKKDCRLTTQTFGRGREEALRAAMAVRKDMGIGESDPILNIGGLIEERCGIKLLLMPIASDDFFGLSVSDKDKGPAIIVNNWERISVERWIFTAVHELGHLVLHLNAYSVDKQDEEDYQEDEANYFAATFLMPPALFEKERKNSCGLSLYDQVLHLKRIFRVSWKTVLKNLHERDSQVWDKFHEAYSQKYSRALSPKSEVEPLNHRAFCSVLAAEEPKHLDAEDLIETRLKTLVRRGLEQGKITQSYAAEILDLDLMQMRELRHMWSC